ncbi:MAG: B12-binding domain-containing radical SAM protein [Candidatus Aminicenantes bacterium]|nr:B12-binding domain-containing radical SAM protein [Candidatus Aminicenantes bacterium]
MRVQLFIPPGGYAAERWTKGSSMPPLGILYIAAALEKEGVDVRVVPAEVLKLGWRDIEREVRNYEPDIVGVTSFTENRFQSFELIRRAKKARPGALTVMGGPHASMAAEDTVEHLRELDLVVRGEGEQTMADLCRALSSAPPGPDVFEQVDGLVFRGADGRPVSSRPRRHIPDLDGIPPPAFHLIPFEKYHFTFEVPGYGPLPAVNIMTSRGCPFNCNFCATPVNWGRRVRMRSPENVVNEIESLVERYGVRVIFFYDDTFNADPRRVEALCDLLLARKLGVFWKCDVRMDIMTRPLLAKMKQAGLFHLSFGLEAGSERVRNEIIGKKIDIRDFHNLVRWCNELEVVPNVFFIFSHPTETWEEARQTIEAIERYRGRIEGSIAILHVYPGTPLEKTARETGVLPAGFSWTKKDFSRIVTLPMAQGDVPLFVDRLSWRQISELVFRWTFSAGKKPSVLRRVPQILKQTRSLADARRYAVMGWVYFRLKLGRLFRKKRPD